MCDRVTKQISPFSQVRFKDVSQEIHFKMSQVVTAQPGTTVVIQQQQKMEREWNSGLFACFDDMGSCKLTVFSP